MNASVLELLPSNACMENIIRTKHPELYSQYKLIELKRSHRPEEKRFYDKPNDTGNYGTRRRSRPWDNCWFSNKPHIISLTIEEAISKHPDYMLWCYKNLAIKWSTHTVRLIESKIQEKTKTMYNVVEVVIG
jgi:hypothetical protein